MHKALFALLTVVVGSLGALAADAEVPALDPQRGVMTMAPLLEKATPAVVNISVQTRIPEQDNPLFNDPFFRRFFDLPETFPERNVMSAGSGVIVDADEGYVLTNHHVISGADRVTITLKDQRQFEAELIGSDPRTDIGLLRIDNSDLEDLPMGDSESLQVGDLVIAIGNPFGLGQTVTSGIVSALGRSGIAANQLEDFIQTDAPINPGNSGGALINSKGELVGINSAILAGGGGNIGIGFAVPVNMASAVMEQLISYGEVRRGRIGVVIQSLTPDLALSLDLPGRRGAIITQVEKDSPAEEVGLRSGDVIIAVDGDVVESATELSNRIGLMEVGSKVRLTFIRKDRQRTVQVEVGQVS